MRVACKGIGAVDKYNDTELQMAIWGENLHAPLVERILELPMDIYGGACLTPRDCCNSLAHLPCRRRGGESKTA